MLHWLDILFLGTDFLSLSPLFSLWAWTILRPRGQPYFAILPTLTVVRGVRIYFRTSEGLYLHIKPYCLSTFSTPRPLIRQNPKNFHPSQLQELLSIPTPRTFIHPNSKNFHPSQLQELSSVKIPRTFIYPNSKSSHPCTKSSHPCLQQTWLIYEIN